ncbi:hypothetical protein [Geomicrobium sp. JCM 19055]|uniref:hypothetical protein n=1 Tax=Geomicrobium sp. JCM 19055 TaxID=1460649 RepID=UPI00045ED522|nr:hypothetical protein [Geomicrobium sp. JCM 19055]GAK01758.1 hypothetical protein JCM19055_4964 [Geomicrobium sp. JCM 19055]
MKWWTSVGGVCLMAGLTGCGVQSSEQANANLEESLEQDRQLELAVQLIEHEDEAIIFCRRLVFT